MCELEYIIAGGVATLLIILFVGWLMSRSDDRNRERKSEISRAVQTALLEEKARSEKDKQTKADIESLRNMVGSLIRDGWKNKDLYTLPEMLRYENLSLFHPSISKNGYPFPPFFSPDQLDDIRKELELKQETPEQRQYREKLTLHNVYPATYPHPGSSKSPNEVGETLGIKPAAKAKKAKSSTK